MLSSFCVLISNSIELVWLKSFLFYSLQLMLQSLYRVNSNLCFSKAPILFNLQLCHPKHSQYSIMLHIYHDFNEKSWKSQVAGLDILSLISKGSIRFQSNQRWLHHAFRTQFVNKITTEISSLLQFHVTDCHNTAHTHLSLTDKLQWLCKYTAYFKRSGSAFFQQLQNQCKL